MSPTAPLPLPSSAGDSTVTASLEDEPAETIAPSTRPAPLAGRRGKLALGLLFVVGALIFLPALRSPFLLDDTSMRR